MVNQLVQRYETNKIKSGIMIVSSALGSIPCPGVTTYSACKSFAGFVGEGLNYELQGKVDVLNYQASEVATKMLGKF